MQNNILFELPQLGTTKRNRMLRYAKRALVAQQRMTSASGESILHYALRGEEPPARMDHYPKGDRIDYQTGAQYFYHCHREDYNTTEHGHFHCFLRYPHIPKRIKPSALCDWDKYIDNPMTHLIAISMNQLGEPIRLFTVNRWISSEIWYDAKHLPSNLNRFKMSLTDDPYWQVLDQWVEAILHLFSPQIHWLHHMRDKTIEQHKLKIATPDNNIYDDISIEELSHIPIHLTSQIQWLLEMPT